LQTASSIPSTSWIEGTPGEAALFDAEFIWVSEEAPEYWLPEPPTPPVFFYSS
jgi:hypothetical protein